MSKYIRRVHIVDAFQYTEYFQLNIPAWFKTALSCGVVWTTNRGEFVLDEDEFIPLGNWIIKGVMGEIWYIPSEEFETYYDKVES